FRDESSTILAADVILDGPVAGGSGLEAFLEKRLQRSGQSTTVSVRLGAEHEWVPGRLRIRGGAYWEPPRFDDVEGRLHLTVGLDVRFWWFSLWGSSYRLRLYLAGGRGQRREQEWKKSRLGTHGVAALRSAHRQDAIHRLGHDFGADAMGFELQKRLNESPVRRALLKCVEVAVHRAEVDDPAIDHRRRHDRPDGDETVGVLVRVL